MVVDALSGIIQQVGFPIVAFLLMYSLVKTTIKENTQAIKDLTSAINQNKINIPICK